MQVEIEVWVCPVDGSYHALSSSHGVDLTQEPKRKKPEDQQPGGKTRAERIQWLLKENGSRADCGHCAANGKRQSRVLRRVTVTV